jgi:hypothetical protein
MYISFPNFKMFILYVLGLHVSNQWVHWACTSGTYVQAEHTHQKLMSAWSTGVQNWCSHWAQSLQNMLSIHVRDWCVQWVCASRTWCVPWAYTLVSNTYSLHKSKTFKFGKVPSKHAELTRKELICALSVRVRNWCLHWTNMPKTHAQAQHAHQKLYDA